MTAPALPPDTSWAPHAWRDLLGELNGRAPDGTPGVRDVGNHTLDCVHCSAEVEIPLSTIGGEKDYWLYDGQELLCESCGGTNRVTCDVETPAEFVTCEEPGCAACGLR